MTRKLILTAFLVAGFVANNLRAQTPTPSPEENPTGNAGALKPQVQTGGSYDAHSGNATRIVNDLHVPGALGVYGLDFTRYWNSTHNDYEDSEMEWPRDFGDSGWSHSWRWTATYEFKYPEEVLGSDHDNNQYTTAINVTFPDGHTTQYKIVRLGHGEWMVPADPTLFGPPYSQGEIQNNFPYGGTGVHDHLCNMATDGSEFWICRADGGSVHFIWDASYGFQAREVFDPHGLKTRLDYTVGCLTHIEQDGGRFINITWEQVLGTFAITRVDSGSGIGGTGVNQTVHYYYASVPGTYGVSLQQVVYDNEQDSSGAQIGAFYHYGNCWGDEPATNPPVCSGSEASNEPLLKRADDPHYAGAMPVIRYNYRSVECPDPKHLPGSPLLYLDYVRAQPYAIAEEKSDSGATVSSFTINCNGGLRTEDDGLGNSRTFYFGTSAQTNEGAFFCRGFQLGKLTNFWRFGEPAAPVEKQNFSFGDPRQIWDGRGIMTEAIVAGGDDSGEPAEIHRADGSVDYYDRVNPGASAAIDPGQGMHNPYNHWVFSETHQINAGTSFTTVYKRDARRRVTDIYYADGSSENFVYNTSNQVQTHTLPSINAATGQPTVVHYDYDGRSLLQQEWNDQDGQANATIYTYDSFDRVETVSHAWSRAKGATFSTQMSYNGRHQVTKVEYPDTPQTACASASIAPSPTPLPTATATATATPTAVPSPTPTAAPVADPVINPNGGSYPGDTPTTVTITTATAGANIRYTLDGTNPSPGNGMLIPASSGTVAVTSTAQGIVLKAIAFKNGWIASTVISSAPYFMPHVADPSISPDGGAYPGTPPTSVTITTTTAGANIRYTLDGTLPSESNGTLIAASSGAVNVTSTVQGTILKAIAFKTGCITSAVKSSAPYFMPQVADPGISPDGGTYPSIPPTTVTISTATAGANIRYTIDGSTPSDTNGTLITASSGAISVTSTAQGTILKAIAFKTGCITSAVKSSAPYFMPQVAAPTFDPGGGYYPRDSFPITVTMATATTGATLRYTVDGTTPTENNGTLIAASSGSISIPSTDSLRVAAFKPGWITSSVQTASFLDDCPPNLECLPPPPVD